MPAAFMLSGVMIAWMKSLRYHVQTRFRSDSDCSGTKIRRPPAADGLSSTGVLVRVWNGILKDFIHFYIAEKTYESRRHKLLL